MNRTIIRKIFLSILLMSMVSGLTAINIDSAKVKVVYSNTIKSLKLKDGSTYVGEVKGKRPHGKGKKTFPNALGNVFLPFPCGRLPLTSPTYVEPSFNLRDLIVFEYTTLTFAESIFIAVKPLTIDISKIERNIFLIIVLFIISKRIPINILY